MKTKVWISYGVHSDEPVITSYLIGDSSTTYVTVGSLEIELPNNFILSTEDIDLLREGKKEDNLSKRVQAAKKLLASVESHT